MSNIKRFRSFEEAEIDLWRRGERLSPAERLSRLHIPPLPIHVPHGIFRYKTFAEAEEERWKWTPEHLAFLRKWSKNSAAL